MTDHLIAGGGSETDPAMRPSVAASAPDVLGRTPSLLTILTAGDVVSVAIAIGVAEAVTGPTPLLYIAVALGVVLTTVPRNRWRFTVSLLDDVPRLSAVVGIAAVAAVAGSAVLGRTTSTDATVKTVAGGLVILTLMTMARALTTSCARWLRKHGRGGAPAIVVGSDPVARSVGEDLRAQRRFGVDFRGYVHDRLDDTDVIGSVNSLPDLVTDHHLEIVIVAFDVDESTDLVDAIRRLCTADCEIYIVPRLPQVHDRAVSNDIIAGVPVVRMRRLAFRSISWRLKRAVDVALAGIALLATLPVVGLVAIAVRWETGSGVIYRQQRVGQDGKLFTMLKLRSLKPVEGEDATRWNIDTDPRLGPVGRFIRQTSLDELPQLFNVLRGDMSIVGPRPERPRFVSTFSREILGYQERHRSPAGLTGLAAINGFRGDTSIVDRAHYDNLYIESWSPGLDFKIMMRTVAQVVSYRPR